MNWREIKEFANKLNAAQLEQKAMVLVEDEGYTRKVEAMEFLEKDIYVSVENEEDLGTIEELKYANQGDFDLNQYMLCTKKGTIFIHTQ